MRVRWNNGTSDSVTIQPGYVAISDPLPMNIAAGSAIRSRTFATVTAGARWGGGRTIITAEPHYEKCEEGVGLTDMSTSGTIATTGTHPYGPMAIIIDNVPDNILTVWGFGDSIMGGVGDSSKNGWFGRAFWGQNNTLAWRHAITGSLAQTFTNYRFQAGIRLSSGAQVGIVSFGINDISSSRTLSQLQGDQIGIWACMAARRQIVYQTTITPRSTSIDGWTTVIGQTPMAQESVRANLNTWLRDGAPLTSGTLAAVATGDSSPDTVRAGQTGHPLAGVIEMANAVESSQGSGLWKASYTTDGVHPNATGHAAMANIISLSTIREAAGL